MILVNDMLAFQKYPMGAVLFCVAAQDPDTNVVFRVTLDKKALAACGTAVRSGTPRWSSPDRLLLIRSTDSEVELLFRIPGQQRAWQVWLDGKDRERFLDAMHVMSRGVGICLDQPQGSRPFDNSVVM